MDMGAAHAGFVIAAYAASALVLGGLAAAVLLRAGKRRRKPRPGDEEG
jgi:heme exporter protein CcmD